MNEEKRTLADSIAELDGEATKFKIVLLVVMIQEGAGPENT
jgi:hypothetical protein